MQSFLIGLQFLTRIRVVRQTVWTEEDFGRSVRFFPLIGAVLGAIYAAIAFIIFYGFPMLNITIPLHLAGAILLAVPILLTGGIHCDGFMDTMDGIFSGRERDRMLEIMKDSRVGSFGVVSFVLLCFFVYSVIQDINVTDLPVALFVMPVIARLMMVAAISLYPYARPEGMGKAFAKYATPKSMAGVILYTLLLIIPFGVKAIIALLAAMVFCKLFCDYVTSLLGGLTGDVYGAVCTMCELVVLIAFLFGSYLFERGIICL